MDFSNIWISKWVDEVKTNPKGELDNKFYRLIVYTFMGLLMSKLEKFTF